MSLTEERAFFSITRIEKKSSNLIPIIHPYANTRRKSSGEISFCEGELIKIKSK